MTNLSAERFTLSHSMILLEDTFIKCEKVESKWGVDSERMLFNIKAQKTLVMTEKNPVDDFSWNLPPYQYSDDEGRFN